MGVIVVVWSFAALGVPTVASLARVRALRRTVVHNSRSETLSAVSPTPSRGREPQRTDTTLAKTDGGRCELGRGNNLRTRGYLSGDEALRAETR
jgi:hypothetical protein